MIMSNHNNTTTGTSTSTSSNSTSSNSTIITIDTLYMYWNYRTNTVSTIPLPIQQLFRILSLSIPLLSLQVPSLPSVPSVPSSSSIGTSTTSAISYNTNVIQIQLSSIKPSSSSLVTNTTTNDNIEELEEEDEGDDDVDVDQAIEEDTTSTAKQMPSSRIQSPIMKSIEEQDQQNQQQQQQQYTYVDGWKPLLSIPIIYEAYAVQWYYSLYDNDNDGGKVNDSNTNTAAKSTSKSTVHGPISTQQLTNLFYNNHQITATTTTTTTTTKVSHNLTLYTQVYSIPIPEMTMTIENQSTSTNSTTTTVDPGTNTNTTSNWTTIAQLPYLQSAMELLYNSQNTVHGNTNNHHNSNNSNDTVYHTERQEQQEQLANIDSSNQSVLTDSTSTDNIDIRDRGGNTTVSNDNNNDDENDINTFLSNLDNDNENNESIDEKSNNINNPQNIVSSSTTTDSINQHQQQKYMFTTNNKIKSKSKSKSTKSKFALKFSKCWIYITGLPYDCTLDELMITFTKAGIFDLHPETQQPKVKLYPMKTKLTTTDTNNTDSTDSTDTNSNNSRDASICYAREESVQLAISLFDTTPFRLHEPNQHILSVQRAKFSAKINTTTNDNNNDSIAKNQDIDNTTTGSTGNYPKKVSISNRKRKVAKLISIQATAWDEGEFNGRITGGRKGLHLIVLKHIFIPITNSSTGSNINNTDTNTETDWLYEQIERCVYNYCTEHFGPIDKITFYVTNPQGILQIKFIQPGSASIAIQQLNNQSSYTLFLQHIVSNNNNTNNNKNISNISCLDYIRQCQVTLPPIEALFWDGVTDYAIGNPISVQVSKQKDGQFDSNTTNETPITAADDNDDQQRVDAFGNWLEQESLELPSEFQLQYSAD